MESKIKSKQLLDRLIVNNEALERLEVELRKFNPFKILRIDQYEIRHSNVLAWLLDPRGTHNLGDLILKKVLSNIILENEEKIPEDVDLHKIELSSYLDAVVYREKNNIDILVVSEGNKLVLLIENKIHSIESKGQLRKYLKHVTTEFKKTKKKAFTILPVYLTLVGDAPKGSDSYSILSHQIVYNIVKSTVDLYKDNMSNQAYDFIKYYLKTLKEQTFMDEKIIKYCKDIYASHKDALDMIWDVLKADSSSLRPAAEIFANNNGGIIITDSKSDKRIWFLPKELVNLPKMSSNWNSGYPFGVFIEVNGDDLKIVYEVGPFDNGESRLDLIKKIDKAGFKVTKKAFRIDSMYTRIFSDKERVVDWDDVDDIVERMDLLYQNSSKERKLVIEVLLNHFN